jgi:hypothetical protein
MWLYFDRPSTPPSLYQLSARSIRADNFMFDRVKSSISTIQFFAVQQFLDRQFFDRRWGI